LRQFDPQDRAIVEHLLISFALVSHTEFERSLTHLIDRYSRRVSGPVALFATREWDPSVPFFVSGEAIDAVGPGSDLGSEARVAALIRNLCRARPDKYLNHPGIEEMRHAHCRRVLVVDDFIGSGERTSDFLHSMWLDASLRSWSSLGWLTFRALAYSGTDSGRSRVEKQKCNPKVKVVRECPTIYSLLLSRADLRRLKQVLRKYSMRTDMPAIPFGYLDTGAAIAFEHGCPDNCSPIFWAKESPGGSWEPLFPSRSVLIEEASVFPPELATPDLTEILRRVRQPRLAASSALARRGPLGAILLAVIALAARGIRTRSRIAYATGLPAHDVAQMLDRCVKWRFLTPQLKLTERGSAELRYARGLVESKKEVPPRGEDWYYPQQLRGLIHG
jgi:hypothetical protein